MIEQIKTALTAILTKALKSPYSLIGLGLTVMCLKDFVFQTKGGIVDYSIAKAGAIITLSQKLTTETLLLALLVVAVVALINKKA